MKTSLTLLAVLLAVTSAAVAAGFEKDWDKNGDGALSWKEAKRKKMPREEFDKADADRNGKLNWREFRGLVVSGIPNGPKSEYAPNEQHYPGYFQSSLWARLEGGETLILHRVVRDCKTDKVMPEKMDGRGEIVWKVGKAAGYVNVVCASRKKEQCELDGTPDQYYEERCETLNLELVTGG